MNGRVAKRLRRAVYGTDGSSRERKYEFRVVKIVTLRKTGSDSKPVKENRLTLTAGPRRAVYQNGKKNYYAGTLVI